MHSLLTAWHWVTKKEQVPPHPQHAGKPEKYQKESGTYLQQLRHLTGCDQNKNALSSLFDAEKIFKPGATCFLVIIG
jgi:hypothetical protein